MSTATPSASTLASMAADPAVFRQHLRIDVGGQLRQFGETLDSWQAADFAAMDAGWLRAIGRPAPSTSISRAYLERPRGHSKTTDLAVMATWALVFAPKRIVGAAAAADKDQAKLLCEAIGRIVACNPWLAELLDVQAYRVANLRTGSTLDAVAADAQSAYGHLLDFLLVDELAHWNDRGEQLWIALASTIAKKSSCLAVVISNAGTGMGSSWQWRVREVARTETGWHFARLDGPVASWITAALLAEQRKLLPEVAYRRLWLNCWTTGAGDALPDDDVDASIVLAGPLDSAEKEWEYAAGLDLGLTRDATALVVVGRHVGGKSPTNRLRLAAEKSWKPTPGMRVSVESIEAAVLDFHKRFRIQSAAFDPWQSEYLAERLGKQGVKVVQVPATPNNLQGMATATIEAFSEHSIALYNEPQLISDLRALRVEEKGGRWRLRPIRDAAGHGDRAIALSLALLAARDLKATEVAVDWWPNVTPPGPFGHGGIGRTFSQWHSRRAGPLGF